MANKSNTTGDQASIDHTDLSGRSQQMKLLDIVARDAIITDLQSTDRLGVISELIDALIGSGALPADLRDQTIEAVIEREKYGTTGFGKGIAVPHVKREGVDHLSAAVGLSQRGIEFEALDCQPVYSVFLLISPLDQPEQHLQAMEIIFESLGKDTFRRFLRQATTQQDVVTLLNDADEQQLPS